MAKELDWKSSKAATAPWVRVPCPPPRNSALFKIGAVFILAVKCKSIEIYKNMTVTITVNIPKCK